MTDRLLQVNGATLHVKDVGDGIPLVFVHGWTGSGEFFRKQVRELPERYRLIVPDLRGHGRSPAISRGHTVTNYAQDIAELIEQLGLAKPVLIGWSMGALIAYELLKLRGSDFVGGLVVIDQGPTDFRFPDYPLGAFTFATLLDAAYRLQNEQAEFVAEFLPVLLHAPDRRDLRWMLEEMNIVDPLVATASLLDQSMRDYRSFLPEIAVPTLLLFGGGGTAEPSGPGQFTRARIPGASLVMFDQSRHLPFYEEPEKFNQALEEFVSTLGT